MALLEMEPTKEADAMTVRDERAMGTQPTEVTERLWAQYRASRSVEDRNRLVLFYAPLVESVARHIAGRLRNFHSIHDICSCGQFGLIDAIEKFDASQGFQFATYATIRIKGAIFDELRRDDILPKRVRSRVRIYNSVRDDLELQLHRTPTHQELAEALHTTVVDVRERYEAASTIGFTSSLPPDEERLGSIIASHVGATDLTERNSLRDAIRAGLSRITERQRQVLVLHYLEGFRKSEVAETLGIDRSRVTQLISQGLHNLRVELRGHEDLVLSA